MTSLLPTLELTLRQHGYSLTKPRRIVFTALQSADTLSMPELTARCADQVDRASVYRTVALFEELGVVQRLPIGWKYRLELTDTFHDHHHHATCVKCGAVIPLPEDDVLERQLQQLSSAYHFVPLSHQLEIRGVCATCQAAS